MKCKDITPRPLHLTAAFPTGTYLYLIDRLFLYSRFFGFHPFLSDPVLFLFSLCVSEWFSFWTGVE